MVEQYHPAQNLPLSGHAPGHLRDAFLEWIDAGQPGIDIETGKWVEVAERALPIIEGQPVHPRYLLGQLWSCTDVLPAHYCRTLDLPYGSTYAQAVRKIYGELSVDDDTDLKR